MGEPAPGDPDPSEPGMEDPGMGEPGMTDPGMGDPSGGEPSTDDPGIPLVFSAMFSSDRALKAAVAAAFQGIDFDELEAAWKAYTLKVH